MKLMKNALKAMAAASIVCTAGLAHAQIGGAALPFQPTWIGNYAANSPSVAQGSFQASYPYPGQCIADPANAINFPGLPLCTAKYPGTSSFDKISTVTFGGATWDICPGTAGGWAACAGPIAYSPLLPIRSPSNALSPFAPPEAVKFVWEVLNPPAYTPDTLKFPGADYYEVGVHEAWGFSVLSEVAGAFPNPKNAPSTVPVWGAVANASQINPVWGGGGVANGPASVPNGMQWTGLYCNSSAGCACRADNAFCQANYPGGVMEGDPIYTPIWGVGQMNKGGTLGLSPILYPAGGPASPWSNNNYLASWPSISIWATRGRPVVVRWVNEFPNNHVLCPHPEAADWPCSIDRTFMGVKPRIDPAVGRYYNIAKTDEVNQYGSPTQPDNSWVTHLHGGDIPPSTDGFAEKWFGNAVTAGIYATHAKDSNTNAPPNYVNPPFENPTQVALTRPNGVNYDTYTYPMLQDEATIWFHDHTLGKTHHNVIAGPAGFFPVRDPRKHDAIKAGVCQSSRTSGNNCAFTWYDPVTMPRKDIANATVKAVAGGAVILVPKYDMFFALQDRQFNEDGSINFSTGLGNPVALPPLPANQFLAPLPFPVVGPGNAAINVTASAPGTSPVTPGANPYIHPVWVPEYFGDHVVINGVLWPKATVDKGWYRLRYANGSDSRCYTLQFGYANTAATGNPNQNPPKAGTNPYVAVAPAVATHIAMTFYVIANDQGYMKKPVAVTSLNMCPGERYEFLVNFNNTGGAGNLAATITKVWLTNTAPAPFPAGLVLPTAVGPDADMNTLMQFNISATAGVPTCAGLTSFNWPPVAPATLGCMVNPGLATFPALTATDYVDLRPASNVANAITTGSKVRMMFLNENIEPTTLSPTGMQLNGVPFEYRVTETPKKGTTEFWKLINLTVDAHPMHPHLVKHLVVGRQGIDVLSYTNAICGLAGCDPAMKVGNEAPIVHDITPFQNATILTCPGTAVAPLAGGYCPVTAASPDGGYKDAVQAYPSQVTTIVAKWTGGWPQGTASGQATAPGTAGCQPVAGTVDQWGNQAYTCDASLASTWKYEDVTSGPYVWHCHINSHEDSEMMRTSLVVP